MSRTTSKQSDGDSASGVRVVSGLNEVQGVARPQIISGLIGHCQADSIF